MAERRMFAKTIIDSDAFLDMPVTARLLYYDLSMRADDDGFINSPKKIQRMIGASDDDLRILITRQFIIPFESGVVVIRHWKIHNYIQKDRYTETKCKKEKSTLLLDENNAYTEVDMDFPQQSIFEETRQKSKLSEARQKRLDAKKESDLPYSFDYKIRNAFVGEKCPICGCVMNYANNLTKPTIQHNTPISLGGKHEIDNISVICNKCNTSIQNREITPAYNTEVVKEKWECIGNVSGMDTQVRLGKDRLEIGKDSIGNITYSQPDVDFPAPKPVVKINFDLYTQEYNNRCYNLPKVKVVTEKRKEAIRKFNREFTLEQFKEICDLANNNDFLTGKNERGWTADFDFLLRVDKATAILEGGKYSNSEPKPKSSGDKLKEMIQGGIFDD